jgi:RimJ/RimL family protein N-acetyltransferase
MQIETERLIMEPFNPSHRLGLNRMNSDPKVMEFLSGGIPDTLDQTDASIARVQERWKKYGYSWWALILRETGELIGAACLQNLSHKEGEPLEIGWRLVPAHHGKGYASEAGQAAADFAFDHIGVDFVKAVCHPDNHASEAVMKRLNMQPLGIEIHYDEPCTTYRLDKP